VNLSHRFGGVLANTGTIPPKPDSLLPEGRLTPRPAERTREA